MISRLTLGKLFQSGYLLQCCIHNVRITADLSVQVTLCVNTTLMHYLHKQFLFGVKESTLKQKISILSTNSMHKASYQIYTSQQPAINVKANFMLKASSWFLLRPRQGSRVL